MKLPTKLHLVLRLRIHGAMPTFPIRLYGMVVYQAQGRLHILLNDNIFYIISHIAVTQEMDRLMT
jgi:hypothetical protein